MMRIVRSPRTLNSSDSAGRSMSFTLALALPLLAVAPVSAQHGGGGYAPMQMEPIEWQVEERAALTNYVQLTNDRMFYKAGEQYFSPDMKWIIFQAVPVPPEGEEPEPFYTMYVAPLEFTKANRISGIGTPIQISPPGSANTCGFFHPTIPGTFVMGTTVNAPSASEAPGFQRKSSKYKWMFPPEMELVTGYIPQVVTADVSENNQGRVALTPITDNERYDAECAYSPDGRFIIYGTVLPDERGVDLFVYDTKLRTTKSIVSAPGYDGGPFFSPDGKRLCYRSDRDSSNLLQIIVADLAFDDEGAITGIEREYQLTNNMEVNWGPYWHPDGRHIVYATSEVSHFNYEVFIIDADPGNLEGFEGPIRYGTNNRRVTHANGFDGLPVFSPDGRYMMWASQRVDDPADKGRTHIWIADFIMPLDRDTSALQNYDPSKHHTSEGAADQNN